jgi:hypothetical protein
MVALGSAGATRPPDMLLPGVLISVITLGRR